MDKRCVVLLTVACLIINVDSVLVSRSKKTSETDSQVCTSKSDTFCKVRYLLYDTSLYEGFNLRYNVHMRMSNLIRFLNDEPEQNWILVLPPWSQLRHWPNRHIPQIQIPWRKFFDIKAINEHVPVIEHEDFVKRTKGQFIDEVYYLQDYKGIRDFWKHTNWEEKMDIDTCRFEYHRFRQDSDGFWRGWFWGYKETKGRTLKCLSVQAQAVTMRHFLIQNTTGRSVAFIHAEQLLHGQYGEWSPEWWTARRSMRYAKKLRDIADAYREEHLDSNDISDKTKLDKKWKTMRREHGDAIGGPYVAVHLRRGDYKHEYKDKIPGLESAADQVKKLLVQYNLNTLFVATDTSEDEFSEFRRYLSGYKVQRFQYGQQLLGNVKDGGIAIIDQLICAHARVFIGSLQSTFSYRIQEEREIMGFLTNTTYLQLCAENDLRCEHKAQWQIVYE